MLIYISFNRMQPCLKITNGSYNLLIKKLHQFRFFPCCGGDSTNARWTRDYKMIINTHLFATVLERLLSFPFKTALWLKMISLIISPSENGFPGWRHRPTQPILLVTRRWTTVVRILRSLKIHRKSRKNRTTIILSPMWSEQKGLFWRLIKNFGVKGTLS